MQVFWLVAVAMLAVGVFVMVVCLHSDSTPLWVLGWVVGISVASVWTRSPRGVGSTRTPENT